MPNALLAWGVVAVVLAVGVAESVADKPEDVPYCDEVDDHPSADGSPSEDAFDVPDALPDDTGVPNPEQVASELNDIISELISGGEGDGSNTTRSPASVEFAADASVVSQQIAAITSRMAARQRLIEELVRETFPSLRQALESRRARAGVLRQELTTMNAKLVALVDSLDRSSYVQEQQNFMTIIDGLMRVQNRIELQSLGSGTRLRASQSHPTAALIQSSHTQALTPRTDSDDAALLDSLHALDLLEISSKTLPYNRRRSMLIKRVSTLLTSLINKFTAMRKKHKEFGRSNREMWAKEVEILQQQTDALTSNLEAVMDQAKFYLSSWEAHQAQLQRLVSAQQDALQQYEGARQRMRTLGDEFHQATQLQSQQLRTIQHVLHLVNYGSSPFTEEVFDFACDGVVGGSSRVDLCGVCGGANSTCHDCRGVVNGDGQMDVCGVCGGFGSSCSFFCDGIPNSGKLADLCGECGGNGTGCLGCDGIPNSGVKVDRCGICGGDGSSCKREPELTRTVVVQLELEMDFGTSWGEGSPPLVRAAVADVSSSDVEAVAIDSVSAANKLVVVSVTVAQHRATAVAQAVTQANSSGKLLVALKSQGLPLTAARLVASPEFKE